MILSENRYPLFGIMRYNHRWRMIFSENRYSPSGQARGQAFGIMR